MQPENYKLICAGLIVKQAVDFYNNERIHWSLELKTPEEVHRSYNSLKYKSYSKNIA